MSFLRLLAADLRERQILPAVVLLVILAIGIPLYASVELSKSSAPTPVSPPPVDVAPPNGLPYPTQEASGAQTAPLQHSTVYKGHEPNPFQRTGSSSGSSSSSKTTTTAATTTPATTAPATTTPTPTPTTTTTTTPSSKPKPISSAAPATLTKDQAYEINAVSTYGAQKDTLNNMQRLTPLPANSTTELVYIGVLKGGKRAAFLLTDAAAAKLSASKSAKCVPSRSDCEVIELAAGEQLETTPTSSGGSLSSFTFKLSAIRGRTYPSSSAAMTARRSASAAGEQVVVQSQAPALARFFYALGLDALIYKPRVPLGTTGSTGSTGATGDTVELSATTNTVEPSGTSDTVELSAVASPAVAAFDSAAH